ncbi:MAG: glutamine--fructose-6-phosphate transaminase (isomerizing) [Elusimicrobia bacterium]|nr:glutamine--fructose-6-phosphate transaminase (isomerizing) [Elusimicrobiota bacterium]
MCGIIGYIGSRQATPIILEGLKNLEYRGYDSAGLAVISNGGVELRRSVGKLSNLDELVRQKPVPGTCAVGHNRWATHGAPSQENAHPHTDCTRKLVVVHNGIIENYLTLKDGLSAAGHVFQSETDSEVVAHLIEEKLKKLRAARGSVARDLLEPLFFDAVRQAVQELHGAYALGILWADCPKMLLGVRSQCPLVVGLGQTEMFLASDVPAFLSYTRKAVFMEDGEIAVLNQGECRFFKLDGQKTDKVPLQIQWDRTMAEKAGFKHFMLKEIYEQPRAIEDTLRGRLFPLKDGALSRECGLSSAALKDISRIHLVACGTAYHAGLIGKYLLEHFAKVPCEVDIASEYRYRDISVDQNTLVVAISQSGETADTLAAVREARTRGAKALAICNSVGSSLTRESDFTLYTHCGPEIGVASTKAFVGQLLALYLLTLHSSLARDVFSETEGRKFVEDILRLPGLIRTVLKLDSSILEIAGKFYEKEHFLFLGRHINYPVALEGALKLKEISYIHAEGYAAGEMKHGPIALIDPKLPVVAIMTQSSVFEKTLSNLEEAKARGALLIALVTQGDRHVRGKADMVLELPQVPEFFSPMINVVPLQLLAYHIAHLRGCDVDQPRNLAKSVTVE